MARERGIQTRSGTAGSRAAIRPRKKPKIGRFELAAKLGSGLQGTVYMGHDPQLDRTVAIKLLNGDDVHTGMPGGNSGWLSEGRNLGKLKHSNVISVYEAGERSGIPFLVFEYVEGTSLKERIDGGATFSIPDAVRLMTQIIAGVAHAHEQGVLHLDLSPGNIMIDAADIPRIMDFGLSRIVTSRQESSDVIVGTPRYMSPEHFTTGDLGPATDVFALGLIWYELITGDAAITGNTPEDICRTLRDEAVDLSRLGASGVDKELVGIIGRALRSSPNIRVANACILKELLDSYLELKREETASVDGEDEQHSTIQFLLRRMERKQDFPALSSNLITLNQMTAEDSNATAEQLANVVLRDYAVSNKLLKLANSAYYGTSNGGVTKVSEAITRLGLDQVRMACNSLIYFNHMNGGDNAAELQGILINSFVSGLIARHLASKSRLRDLEEAFICGMFRDLGRTLALYYFAEDYAAILEQVERGGLSETQAFIEVLGVPAHSLGIAVARSWKFPDVFVDAMQCVDETRVAKPASRAERMLIFAAFGNDLCAIAAQRPVAEKAQHLAAFKSRYEDCFNLTDDGLCKLLAAAVEKFRSFASVLGVIPDETPCIQRMTAWLDSEPASRMAETEADDVDDDVDDDADDDVDEVCETTDAVASAA